MFTPEKTATDQAERQEDMHDIVIVCPGSIANDLLLLFQMLIHDYKNVDILWHGSTRRYGMGMIVLECEGVLPEALQRELDTNKRITDYATYDVPAYFQVRGEEKP